MLRTADADGPLADLVDKSLVQPSRRRPVPDARDDPGLRAETPRAAGEAAPSPAAHAAYFLDLAEAAAPYIHRAEQFQWLARLGAEADEIDLAILGAAPPTSDGPVALPDRRRDAQVVA